MLSQFINFLGIFIFFCDLNFKILLNLLDLLFNLRSIFCKISACHIVVIFKAENIFFELGDFSIDLDFLFDYIIEFSLFFYRFKIFNLTLIVLYNFFIVRYFTFHEFFFSWGRFVRIDGFWFELSFFSWEVNVNNLLELFYYS